MCGKIHFSDREIAVEINQQASGSELLWDTLTEASLAHTPGVRAVIGIVAVAATYFHPAIKK